MVPPFPVNDFEEMSKQEAKRHFEWFVQEVPYRLELLEGLFNSQFNIALDYTTESLSLVWDRYKTMISKVPLSKEELNDINKLPEWIRESVNKWKLSTDTLALLVDVSIYFAQVFLLKYPKQLQWGFVTSPRKYVSINRPVITGFKKKMKLDPRLILLNISYRELEADNSKSLLDIFQVWERDI
ncbi:hypothetical protein D3C86_838290 [compost metagenome]